MSYYKHVWQNNEIIDASKLNNIEDGIAEAHELIAEGGTGAPGVGSIDNIGPDESGNVTLTMIFDTQDEFDDSESSIPVGARVVKRWED
jgi:hypothetical protein